MFALRQNSRCGRAVLAGCSIALLVAANFALAADWPCHRADAARSGVTEDELGFPLGCAWTYVPSQPPRPAWPEPGKEPQRIDFDYAPEPVIAGGRIYFSSSADDTIRALEAATGRLLWLFTTDGPVRFAPAVAEDRAFVASDDGLLYCLQAGTGRLLWKFRGGPRDERVIGNGRMISRWPLRSGVLVDDGVAYLAAGMWPSEGVFVYALDAATGRVLWVNDTCGIMYLANGKNGGQFSGVAPQGYLAASRELLLVPTGRAVPAAFDRRTGRCVYYKFAQSWAEGGCWTTVLEEKGVFINGVRGGHTVPYRLSTGLPVPWDIRSKMQPSYRFQGTQLYGPDWKVAAPHDVHSLARAGRTVIVGGDGFIGTYDAGDGSERWSDEVVEGQVRGIAVSNGRLVASTDKGLLYCFEQGKAAGGKPRAVGPHPMRPNEGVVSGDQRHAAEVLARLQRAGVARGFVLVWGGANAHLGEMIARRTALHVVAALRDAGHVAAERSRLLSETDLYGSRLVVHHIDDPGSLPYARYFANAVVAASGTADDLPMEELCRVLQPCGGLLILVGFDRGDAAAMLAAAEVPPGGLRAWQDGTTFERGKLPGAFDWDSEVTCDHRVKWPLELLWFGGPGPARFQDRHRGVPFPVAANGRYFAIGEHCIIAIDAYNGSELWTRDIPNASAWTAKGRPDLRPFRTLRSLAADDEHVYVNLGEVCYRLDAATGAQQGIYGSFNATEVYPLSQPQTFHLEADPEHSGTITLSKSPDDILISLTAEEPEAVDHAVWELYFDFRPHERRVNLYGSGVFGLTLDARSGVCQPAAGPRHPEVKVTRTGADNGSTLALRLPRAAIADVAGYRPEDFGFEAVLSYYAPRGGGEELRFRKQAFAETVACNNGWAVFRIGSAASAKAGKVASVEPMEDLPSWVRSWGRRPHRERSADDVVIDRATGPYRYPTNPLTDQARLIPYHRAHGCGGNPIPSLTLDFYRSSTLGIYDYTDDAGIRNFDGIRPGCGSSGLVPAFGLLVSSAADSGCVCHYNYQTSLALAPASKRSNEDWAAFYDTDAGGCLECVSLNLNAPGDRRDADGALWLGFPRPLPGYALHVPLSLDVLSKCGNYRYNADRVAIGNTTRPWIYASGIRGIRKAVLALDLLEHPAVSVQCSRPPEVDGVLADSCWGDLQPLAIAAKGEDLFFCHDDVNLYVAFKRPAAFGFRGLMPWETGAEGDDAPVWLDGAYSSFEMYLTDNEEHMAGIHLGLSASGASYEGLWKWDEGWESDVRAVEDTSWQGQWTRAVKADENAFIIEMAIPWSTLAEAGLSRSELLIEANNQRQTGPIRHPASKCRMAYTWRHFRPLALVAAARDRKSRPHTVRLHFMEPDDVQPGRRVFDVKLQGQTVLKGLDICQEAGARNTALVREFRGIEAERTIALELVPGAQEITALTAPVLSGIEFEAEAPW